MFLLEQRDKAGNKLAATVKNSNPWLNNNIKVQFIREMRKNTFCTFCKCLDMTIVSL